LKKYSIFILALFVCSLAGLSTALGQADGKASSAGESLPGPEIGTTISNFKLPNVNGELSSLASLKGKNGTVLIFIAVKCPVSNAYNERMEKLAQDYQARGINVIGINSNATEPTDSVKQHASEHQFTFPILKDDGQKIADTLGAQHTPEAFLLDANNKLVYRGRIDNSKNAAMVSSNDLRDAMEEVLAGRPVTKTQARAFGCTIKRSS
jgi:peroxiredoxin